MPLYRYLIIALCLFNFIANAADNHYWEEYLKEKKAGKIANLKEHIQTLCSLPAEGISSEDLEKRRRALFYFLSTGGKNGFRTIKTPPEEKVILENAYLFLGMLTEMDYQSSSNLDLQRNYKTAKDSDKKIDNHFTIAQQYFTVGRMIANWQQYNNLNYARIILSNNFILPRLNREFGKGNQTAGLQDELRSLSTRFTPALMDRGLEIWNQLAKSLQDPDFPLKSTADKEADNTGLRQALSSIGKIVRDTLAYHYPMQVDTSNVPSITLKSYVWNPCCISKGSRPMGIILSDGTLIIKRADNTLFISNKEKSPLFAWKNKITSLGGKGPQDFIEDSQALTDQEILDKLGTISPVVSSFYYGKEEDYDNLALADVWPEPLLVIFPKPRPWGLKSPNLSLIKDLEEESIKECEEGIRKLGLPTYTSPFVNNKNLIKILSETMDHLRKLQTAEKETKIYQDLCRDLESAVNVPMQSMDFAGMRGFYRTKRSELHSQGILKTAFDALKKVKANLRKAKYLSTHASFNTLYPPKEPYEAKDVPSDTLPSDPKIEEGEAELVYSKGILNITAKTNFTVITFDQFWIGADAKIIAHLPTSGSKISLYQRSGKPCFLLGRFEHAQGFANFYYPYGAQGLPANSRFCLTGGVYTPESDRRYPKSLSMYSDNDPWGGFGRWGSDKEVVVDENFLKTPEGQFEQAMLAFREKFVPAKKGEDAPKVLSGKEAEAESTPAKIAAYKDFLKVCQDYISQRREAAKAWEPETDKELGVGLFCDEEEEVKPRSSYDKNREAKEENDLAIRHAQTIEGETQYELAVRLCISVQNLPLKGGFPVFEEAIQLLEDAEKNGFRGAEKQKEEIKMTMAGLLCKEVSAESTKIDQSINHLEEGIELLETRMTRAFGESADRDKTPLSQLRRQMKSDLGIFLANKAQSLLEKDPCPKEEIESLLLRAERIFEEIRSFVDTAQTNLETVRKIQLNFRETLWKRSYPSNIPNSLGGVSANIMPVSAKPETEKTIPQPIVVKPPYKMPSDVDGVIEDIRQGKLLPTFLRSFVKKNPKARDESYLSLYKALIIDSKSSLDAAEALVEAYPHPELICLYLKRTKQASQLHLRQLVSNEQFMKEKAIEFFSTFVPSLSVGEQGMVTSVLAPYPAVLETITAAKKN
ncbi:MAG: hypothetical protein K2W94_04540 [Alphaproteobacteria bacterium]|nr:hypothetical protein [Alphaproteobacteria bacterium]